MEIKTLDKDIKVFYVRAESFPDGIEAAYHKLFEIVKENNNRKFYGISYGGKDGKIIYLAAAQELSDGEAEKFGCETFIIRKGKYLSETLHDWSKNIPRIGEIFQELLKDPRVDKNGYCLEVYPNPSDVICMTTLK